MNVVFYQQCIEKTSIIILLNIRLWLYITTRWGWSPTLDTAVLRGQSAKRLTFQTQSIAHVNISANLELTHKHIFLSFKCHDTSYFETGHKFINLTLHVPICILLAWLCWDTENEKHHFFFVFITLQQHSSISLLIP